MGSEDNDLAVLKSASLTSVLERQLERLIIKGELAPGERLNEIQLAARFGTSRGPLREAARSLEAKGFVEAIRNRGVFVRRLNLAEAIQIYDLRGALFALAGRLAVARIDDDLIAKLRDLVAAMEISARNEDVDSYYPVNLQLHTLILEASGNDILIQEYNRFVNKMHLFRVKSLVDGGGLAVSNDEHAALVDALEARDADRAFLVHMQHVERAKTRMILAIQKSEPGVE